MSARFDRLAGEVTVLQMHDTRLPATKFVVEAEQ